MIFEGLVVFENPQLRDQTTIYDPSDQFYITEDLCGSSNCKN